jgi:hypothetical protein
MSSQGTYESETYQNTLPSSKPTLFLPQKKHNISPLLPLLLMLTASLGVPNYLIIKKEQNQA